MNPSIVFIHGANQSSKSWGFIKHRLDINAEFIDVDYDSSRSFFDNLEEMTYQLKDRGPLFLVSHSLGGIYSLHLQEKVNVIGSVSISTPFKGSLSADWIKFLFPHYPLFRDVGTRGKPIVMGHSIPITVPWRQIVSVRGNVPYAEGPNDGVVGISSMLHRQEEMECIEIDGNHYEVMLMDEVVESIKDWYLHAKK